MDVETTSCASWETSTFPSKENIYFSLFLKKNAHKYPNVKFITVDVDRTPQIAEKARISSCPTSKFFIDGEKVGEVLGFSSRHLIQGLESISTELHK